MSGCKTYPSLHTGTGMFVADTFLRSYSPPLATYVRRLGRLIPAKSGRSAPRSHRPKAVLSPAASICPATGEGSEGGGVPDEKQRNDLLKQEQLSSHIAVLIREFSRILTMQRRGHRHCSRGQDTGGARSSNDPIYFRTGVFLQTQRSGSGTATHQQGHRLEPGIRHRYARKFNISPSRLETHTSR